MRSPAIRAAPIEKPSAVGAIRVPGLTAATVQLEWEPPASGEVEEYLIEVANQTLLTDTGPHLPPVLTGHVSSLPPY